MNTKPQIREPLIRDLLHSSAKRNILRARKYWQQGDRARAAAAAGRARKALAFLG